MYARTSVVLLGTYVVHGTKEAKLADGIKRYDVFLILNEDPASNSKVPRWVVSNTRPMPFSLKIAICVSSRGYPGQIYR